MVPSWVILGIICFLGLMAVVLGVMGFGPAGIPLTQNARLTGLRGKVTGVPCILLGLAILWVAGNSFLGPTEEGFARGFMQALPFGVAVYAVARILWFQKSRPQQPIERPVQAPRSRASTSIREMGEIIECPHCGKSMVDTGAERCRFCRSELPPM
jgi:hypothetical protein